MANSDGYLCRSNFGRAIKLGDLYDVTSDQRVGHIFNNTIPPNCIYVQKRQDQEFEVLWTDSYSEKFEKFKIDGEAKLNVLFNVLNIDGAGKIFTDKTPKTKTVQCHLIQNVNTVYEEISPYHVDLQNYYVKKISSGTHLVVGITWGATAVATVLSENTTNDSKNEIDANLKIEMINLKNLLSKETISDFIGGKEEPKTPVADREEPKTPGKRLTSGRRAAFDFERTNNESSKMLKIEVKFYADIFPQGYKIPQTLDQAIEIIEKIPQAFSSGEMGKGKPLFLHLMPLNSLRGNLIGVEISPNCIYKPVPEYVSLQVEHLFELIEESRQKLDEFHYLVQKFKSKCIPDAVYREVDKYYKEFLVNMKKLEEKLKNQLIESRRGHQDAEKLNELCNQFNESEYSPSRIIAFVEKYTNLKVKIKQFDAFVCDGAQIIASTEELAIAKLNKHTKTYFLFISYTNDREDQFWDRTITHFSKLCKTVNHDESKLIVVDKDSFLTEIPDVEPGIRICSFSNNKFTNIDDFDFDNEKSESCCMIKPSEEFKPTSKKRNVRTPLIMRCPCTDMLYEWKCYACKEILKYGFDNEAYCSKCGHFSLFKASFKCANSSHGENFLEFKDQTLKNLLEKIELPKHCKLKHLVYDGLLDKQLKVFGYSLKGTGYNPIADIHVDNYTNETLVCNDGETVFGSIAQWKYTSTDTSWLFTSPTNIESGMRFMFGTQINYTQCLVGIRANICWQYRDRLILLYWAVPKQTHRASNTFGIAITKPGIQPDEVRFSAFLSTHVTALDSFTQYVNAIDKATKDGKIFKKSNSALAANKNGHVQVEDEDIEIRGLMTFSTVCDIYVQIIPKKKGDYASNFANYD